MLYFKTKPKNKQQTPPLQAQDYKIDYLIEPTIVYTRMTQTETIKPPPQVALYV